MRELLIIAVVFVFSWIIALLDPMAGVVSAVILFFLALLLICHTLPMADEISRLMKEEGKTLEEANRIAAKEFFGGNP